MKIESFIARRLRFEGRVAVIAIAISFFVMILAVSVAAGFRKEIHSAVSSLSGDVIITESPLILSEIDLDAIARIEGVERIEACIYEAAMAKKGDEIRGVIFKGSSRDSISLHTRIPEQLATELSLEEGDKLLSYFAGDRLKIRQFEIDQVYDNAVETADAAIAFVPISDLRRIRGWDETRADCLEITLSDQYSSRKAVKSKTAEIAYTSGLRAEAARDKYSSIFSWLDLIDYNVYAILLLMTIVAAFNMISGLLILLFRNISTIGTLKAVGMTDKAIASVFLRMSARISALGMLAGNVLSLLFCFIQDKTGLIRLDPANYFVSEVPVAPDLVAIMAADAIAFAAIMIVLLIPCLFISKIDPASTVKSE